MVTDAVSFTSVVTRPGRRLLLALSLLFLMSATRLFAAPQDYAGKPVAAIEFEPATQLLSQAEIDRNLGISIGKPLDLKELSAGLERLYGTGRYADIQVEAELREGGVVLRFLTKPAWFIGRVTVEGVPDPPNRGQLENATKLELGSQFTERAFRQAIEKLEQLLKNNGFYRARIESDFEAQPEVNQVNIRFFIEPGERAKFAHPTLTGDLERRPEDIVGDTGWKRLWGLLGWKTVTENRVQRGLENIRTAYRKDNRLLASVALDDLKFQPDPNTVTPALKIDAGPTIEIRTEGAKISRGKLRQLIPIYQEQSVDKDLLVEGAGNIQSYLQSEGYFDARVNFKTADPSTDKEVITFVLDRGPRHSLKHLEISGHSYFDTATIRERMYLRTANLLQFRHGRFSEEYLERDRQAITDLYRGNGFREVKVSSRIEANYEGDPKDIAVYLQIEEGPQWFVSALEISGVNLRDYEYIQSLLHSSEGQPYSEINIAADRDAILSFYYNNGFPDASFDFTATPGPGPHQMQLKFIINEGPRYFIRQVLVGGLDTTDPELVRERILLRPGDALSQIAMNESQRNLYELGIFAKVDTAVQNSEGKERNKNVLYEVEEARKYSLNAGVGAEIARIGGGAATNLTSPGGSAGFSPRVSVGISRSNFLGVAHTVSLNTRFSSFQRRGVINYLAPQFKGNQDISLNFTGIYDDSRDVRTFAAKRMEASAQVGQRLSKANTAQYRIQIRRVSVDENTLKITPGLIPLFSQPVRVTVVGGSFIQDRRDDPLDARRGIYNTVDLGVTAKFLGSQTDFSRLLARNATYHQLTRQVVFARQTTFGWMYSFASEDQPLQDIPLPERFFSGGASSHRGFSENQAGGRDLTTGFPIGGKALVMNTLELRYPLVGENLTGVLFHDAGNVYSSLRRLSLRQTQRDDSNFDYMVHAVGFGIRYRTPVGPVRVDLAYVPNSPRFWGFEGTREELLFNCAAGPGPQCPRTLQRLSRFQFHFSLGQAF